MPTPTSSSCSSSSCHGWVSAIIQVSRALEHSFDGIWPPLLSLQLLQSTTPQPGASKRAA
eukprot:1161455-Pelagomonas_calceolata.AAC.1